MKSILIKRNRDPLTIDAAERKGIGHPDSLADMVADEFSRLYSIHCLERWGVILNHWVDKVNLVGAASTSWYGGFRITKPISVYVFGKITPGLGGELIPLDELTEQAARNIFSRALGDQDILSHCRYIVENSVGEQPDHAKAFYHPDSVSEARDSQVNESVANDTVLCSAYASKQDLSIHARMLERRITDADDDIRKSSPEIGTDVKVSLVLVQDELDITICVPVHPDRVDGRVHYDRVIGQVNHGLNSSVEQIASACRARTCRVALNTKDSSSSTYIAPFGTALGKGDCGAVGRGNKINGAISAMRPGTGEAPSGKNPLHHVGKLYTIAAQMIVSELVEVHGAEEAEILIATDNGRPLRDPRVVAVNYSGRDIDRIVAEELMASVFEEVSRFWKHIVKSDVIDVFKNGGLRRLSDVRTSLDDA